MTTFNAIVQNRRIEIEAPQDLPDGTEVRVEVSMPVTRLGIPESEWEDDPEAIAEWSAWLKTIEPIEFATADAFDETFRKANIEAVRNQMTEADR
jgi:hypothetical protein